MSYARPYIKLFSKVTLVALLLLVGGLWRSEVKVQANVAAGFSEYIIPFDEDVFAYVTQPVSNTAIGANDTTFTLISVTAWSDTVTVYFDHWENGYGLDLNNLDATADEKYTINQSQTLNFNSATVPRPRTGADGNTYVGAAGNCTAQPAPTGFTPVSRATLDYCYDGRDRIVTVGGATTVTRGGYLNTAGMGKLAAIGEEVYPLSPQLVKYVLPFPENAGRNDYQRVMAVVQATEDNTTLQVDFNGDGTYDAFNTEDGYRTVRANPTDATIITLQKGQTYVVDRLSVDSTGATALATGVVILGSKTLQVEYFYGQFNSGFNTRAVSAYPRGFWSNEYYAPAGSSVAGRQTEITLYNPNSSAITIDWETSAASGSFSIPAASTSYFRAATGTNIPAGSGVYLKGFRDLLGISDIDTNSTDYDWGYSLVPTYLLSDDQTLAWAPGNSPTQACNTANARSTGIYLTPAQDNTTIYIDKNGDGAPDTDPSIEVIRGTTPVAPTGAGYKVNRLESIYITGSNSGNLATSPCDLTGARIYATGPFSMAFGENDDRASAGGGLDLGYTVLPSPENWMDLALTVDKTTSPVLVSTVAGVTTVTYTLKLNSHTFHLDTVSAVDTLPANWTYDNNSTVITLPDLTTISGAGANPTVSLPTLTWPSGLFPAMEPDQEITITFTARTTAAFANGAVTQNKVQGIATRVVGGVTQTFKANDFALNTYTDGSLNLTFTKSSSVPFATPVSPGDTLTYTLTPTNPVTATTTQTGVSVLDNIPAGTTYVAASGSVTCELPRNVRDEFAAAAYTNNGPNNTANWASNWIENDIQSSTAGAGAGFVQVTGNQLRLAYASATVQDNFGTNGNYTTNNGTNNFLTNWTESGEADGANAGFIRIATNRMEFQASTPVGRSLRRSANATGATSISLSYLWLGTALETNATDEVVVEYATADAGPYSVLRTLNGDASATFTDTITWTPTDTTIFIRFRAIDPLEGGELASFDNVRLLFNNAVGASVYRTANLTGAVVPQLSFTSASAGLEANDTLVIEAATSAAGPFTTLATFSGGTPDVAGPYSLTPYIAATTTIRFRITGNFDVAAEAMTFDNVDISYGLPSTFASGNPPEFVAASTGCRIRPNNSMTVTFNVTVNNPYPTQLGDITNIGSVTTNELPIPITASAVNQVLVPAALSATVGDRVWLDSNGNGVFDPGESGIGGVTVKLKDNFGAPLLTTTTDANGLYLFTGVAPGTGYYVEATSGLPGGLTQTTSTVADQFNIAGDGSQNTGGLNWATNWTETGDGANALNAGDIQIASGNLRFIGDGGTTGENIRRTVSVSGTTSITLSYAWGGSNVGGTALAAGSDRIQVQYSTDGTTWTTARTIDAGTAQTFTDTFSWTPTNGTFFLRFNAQDNLEAGKIASIDNVQVTYSVPNATSSFDLTAGQDYTQADIGYQAAAGTAAIGDLVWVDADQDGVRDPGEAGLGGVTVQLYAADANGLPTGPVLQTAVTNAAGAYLFTGVTANGANDYAVTLNTGQSALTNYTATTSTNFYFPNIVAGTVADTADFGFYDPAPTTSYYSISDGVWLDNGTGGGTANNGTKDGGEVGIAGVTVNLLNNAGVIVATTTTNASGIFTFPAVPAGVNYTWEISDTNGVLANYFPTSTAAIAGEYQMVGSLGSNLNYTATPHFGYNFSRAIGDTVFRDSGVGGGTANNGVQDGTEPGIPSVTVLLYRDDGDGVYEPGTGDTLYGTQVTDANGQYLFAGLPSGFFWWTSIDPTQSALSGLTRTTADNSGVAGDQRYVTPALVGNAVRLDIDYGYYAPVSFTISGKAFSDDNRNGADNTEPGLQNVTIQLVNQSGTVIASTTTAAGGTYSFAGLPNGTYTVRITDTNSVLSSYETTYEKTEGALAASYNGLEVVTLSGASVTDVNFGYYKPSVTRVTIGSFLARDMGGQVALEWETTSEAGTIGFFLERRDGRRDWTRVNEHLLPSLLTPHGGLYRYIDPAASVGETYRYRLIEVEASGRRNVEGPYTVNTAFTAERDAATGAQVSVDPDPRRSGFAKAARVARQQRIRQRLKATGSVRAAGAKIAVTDTAIHYVSLADLTAKAGWPADPSWLTSNRNLYALTSQGSVVPFTPAPGSPGFLFYGKALDSLYSRDNVYWLGSATRTSPRMATRNDVPGSLASGAQTFVKTAHFEQNSVPAPGIYTSASSDFWLWDFLFAGDGPKSFPFRTAGATGAGTATLSVHLKGGSNTSAPVDHHVVVRVNGNEVAQVTFDGLDEKTISVDVDGSTLVDGDNEVELEALLDPGVDYSFVYLDAIDVAYQSRYRADANRATVNTAANSSVLIDGFTRSDIVVLDVTDASAPVRVNGTVVSRGAGYAVALAPRRQNTVYAAAAGDAFASAAWIEADVTSNLKAASNRADYLIVAPSSLTAVAQALADHRSDLRTQVVDIEDIYDEFSYGISDPGALRAFLKYASTQWRTRPRYVVLAGDGTWDYKDALGMGNPMPPMMVETPDGLFPSDNWYADFNGNGPEVALGRLPAANATELTAMIDKIKAREAATGSAWLKDALMVADNPDDGGDFTAGSAQIAGHLPAGTSVTSLNLAELGADETRVRFLDGLNAGKGIVNYIGHGGYTVLADEGLLWAEDVDYLTNDKTPVMTAMTCLAGNFALPWVPSVAEQLVRKGGSGVAAMWAPSGMSENDLAVGLAETFYDSSNIRGTSTRLGDAVLASLKAYAGTDKPKYMLAIYGLLGDPAMKIK